MYIKLAGGNKNHFQSQKPPAWPPLPLADNAAIISCIYLPLLLRGQRRGKVKAGRSITEENMSLSSTFPKLACWNLPAVWDKVCFKTKKCAGLHVKLSSRVSRAKRSALTCLGFLLPLRVTFSGASTPALPFWPFSICFQKKHQESINSFSCRKVQVWFLAGGHYFIHCCLHPLNLPTALKVLRPLVCWIPCLNSLCDERNVSFMFKLFIYLVFPPSIPWVTCDKSVLIPGSHTHTHTHSDMT